MSITLSLNEDVKRASEFVRSELTAKNSGEETITAFCECAEEIFSSIARASSFSGSVILSVEEVRGGMSMRFMNPGSIFNPCPDDKSSVTRREMDEISFEFKYGHNVLSLFRKSKI